MNILGAAATEVIKRSNSGTITYADGHRFKPSVGSTLTNISLLLDNLNTDSTEQNQELNRIQHDVTRMMNVVTARQLDLFSDLTGLMESIKHGVMPPDQLELMIRTEQDRSEAILHMATSIGGHLHELFSTIENVIDHIESGNPLPVESYGNPVRSQMNLVQEGVDGIQRIIATPPAALAQTLGEVEKDLAVASGEVERAKQSTAKPSSAKVNTGASSAGPKNAPPPRATSPSSSNGIGPKIGVQASARGGNAPGRVGFGVSTAQNGSPALPAITSPTKSALVSFKAVGVDVAVQTDITAIPPPELVKDSNALSMDPLHLSLDNFSDFSSQNHTRTPGDADGFSTGHATPDKHSSTAHQHQHQTQSHHATAHHNNNNTHSNSKPSADKCAGGHGLGIGAHGTVPDSMSAAALHLHHGHDHHKPAMSGSHANRPAFDDSVANSVASSALNSPRGSKIKKDGKFTVVGPDGKIEMSIADSPQISGPSSVIEETDTFQLQLKIQLLEAKVKELETSLANAQLAKCLSEGGGAASTGKMSMKLAAKKLMQSVKAADNANKGDSALSTGGSRFKSDAEGSEIDSNMGGDSNKGPTSIAPEVNPNLLLGGGGFKELQSHTNHPHYHPGATVMFRKAPHAMTRGSSHMNLHREQSGHLNLLQGGHGGVAPGMLHRDPSFSHGSHQHQDPHAAPNLADGDTFQVGHIAVHTVVHHQIAPAHEVGYLPPDIPFAGRHIHHHSTPAEEPGGHRNSYGKGNPTSSTNATATSSGTTTPPLITAPGSAANAAGAATAGSGMGKKMNLKDAIFKATGKKPVAGMNIAEIALSAAAAAAKTRGPVNSDQIVALFASQTSMNNDAGMNFPQTGLNYPPQGSNGKQSMKSDVAINMARIVPKMHQETTTDDLEEFIFSQGVRSGQGFILPAAAMAAGLSAVNRVVAMSEKMEGVNPDTFMSSKMSNRSKMGASKRGAWSKNTPGLLKAVLALKEEQLTARSGEGDAVTTDADAVVDTGASSSRKHVVHDSTSNATATGTDGVNVSPLTVDENLSMDDTMNSPRDTASSAAESYATMPLHAPLAISAVKATLSSQEHLVKFVEDGGVSMAKSPISSSRLGANLHNSSFEDTIAAAAHSQKLRLEASNAMLGEGETDSAGGELPTEDRAVLEFYSNVLAPVADDHLDALISEFTFGPNSARVPPAGEPRGAHLLSKMHSTYSSARSGMMDSLRQSPATPTSHLEAILSSKAIAPQQRTHMASTKGFADEFRTKLLKSINPLRAIYDEYGSCLPDYFKSRLLMAIPNTESEIGIDGKQISSRVPSPGSFPAQIDDILFTQQRGVSQQAKKFFSDLLPLMENILEKATLGLSGIRQCENSLVTILSLTISDDRTAELAKKSVASLFRKLGALEALHVFVDVQMGEYRSVFDGINALSANTFPTLMKACAEFKNCFKSFQACQNVMVEVANRVAAVKAQVVASKINSLKSVSGPVEAGSHSATHAGHPGNNNNNNNNNNNQDSATGRTPRKHPGSDPSAQTKTSENISLGRAKSEKATSMATKLNADSKTPTVSSEELKRATKSRDNALHALQEAQMHFEELELELMKERELKDRTPGALAFFATLNDPVAIITFHSMYNLLGTLKPFVNCEEHLEFPVLRNRLKQCISQLPIVERFITRYDLLHKRWTTRRMALFLDRGQTGSAADVAFTCPICDCDSRVTVTQHLTLPEPSRAGVTPQKILKPTEKMSKTSIQARAAALRGPIPPIDTLPHTPKSQGASTPNTGSKFLESGAVSPLTSVAHRSRRVGLPITIPGMSGHSQPQPQPLYLQISDVPGNNPGPMSDSTLSPLSMTYTPSYS